MYQNKPYAVRTAAPSSSSSSSSSRSISLPISLEPWNYNVSHHGKYVCVASHPTLMVSCIAVVCCVLCSTSIRCILRCAISTISMLCYVKSNTIHNSESLFPISDLNLLSSRSLLRFSNNLSPSLSLTHTLTHTHTHTLSLSYLPCQVGVDLVDVTARSWNAPSFAQYFSLFEKCFGVQEKEFIFKYLCDDRVAFACVVMCVL